MPQGGARFRLARDRAMTDVILDTDADLLGAWNAVAGQTAAFADVLALGARDFLAVASAVSLRIQIAQDGTITTTPGTVTGDLKRVHGSAALLAAVGVNGAIRTSTDAGATYTVRTAAASYSGTFSGVNVRNAYVVVAGAAGMVQRSVNAGAIFNQINPDNGYTGDFTDIAGDGAGALIFVGTGGEVQTSADDGATLIKRALPGNYAGTLRAVAMTPAGFAVAVGDNGAIFTSSDRGATWAVKSAAGGFTGSFYGVAAVGRSVVAVGAGAQIQTSTDGGETFTARLAGGGAAAALRAVALDPNLYGLALGDGGAFQRTLRLEGAVTSFTVPAGILGVNQVVFAQGGYYSQDGARSPLSEVVAFATAATFAYVNAPQIVQPAAGDTGVAVKPLIQTGPFATTGQADTHAASRYQIATSSGFAAASILYDSGEVSDLLQHQVSAVTLPVDADLFVRAYHKGQALGVGAWLAPVAFRAQNRPAQPAILAPSDKATGVGLSPQITVSAFNMPSAVQDAIQIQAGTGSDFAAPLYDSGVVTAAGSFSGFRLPVGTLPAATQIFARARQRAASGAWSLWSPVIVFRTRAAGGIAEAHAQLLWTGNGQPQFVRTDLDLTPGGAILAFGRDSAARFLVSTARGVGELGQPTQVGDLSLVGDAYTSRSDVLNGLSLAGFTAGAALSEAGKRYLAYVFRNQARFFKTGVMPSTVDQNGQRVVTADLSTLGTVGAVLMKQVSAPRTPPVDPEYVGPLWYLWHRSYANEWVFNINSFTWSRPNGGFSLPTINGTTLKSVGYETPVEYLAFAHDPSADGVVQCVSFSNGQVQAYDTGWPEGVQFALLRRVDIAGGANEPWQFVDVARAPGFAGNDRPIATAGVEATRDMLTQSNGVVSLGPEALYGGGQYIAVLIRAVG
ncbi:WD40/YVTN/BNR-like repeat-containing protein [Methylobacterium gregans]|uniref:WD40/YVTN/BNR-like repeat-containing protein n=1 Tax=Methylobacterium gregans TaxID=374424 RepID=UPI003621C2FE